MIEFAIPIIPGGLTFCHAAVEFCDDNPEAGADKSLATRIGKYEDRKKFRETLAMFSFLGMIAQAIIAIASKSFPLLISIFIAGAALNCITFLACSCLILTATLEINKLKEIAAQQLSQQPSFQAHPGDLNLMD